MTLTMSPPDVAASSLNCMTAAAAAVITTVATLVPAATGCAMQQPRTSCGSSVSPTPTPSRPVSAPPAPVARLDFTEPDCGAW